MTSQVVLDRFGHIKTGAELRLSVEGRYTNLRIWTGKDAPGRHQFTDHDTVFMRLDRVNHYSVPLNNETVSYLEKQTELMTKLANEFGFKSHIDKLPQILELTNSMPVRMDIVEW